MAAVVDFLDLGQVDDLLLPEAPPPRPQGLLRIRQTHHLLARKLAEGAEVSAAAALTGYAPSTIYSLKADPTFQELMEYYKSQVEALEDNFQDRLGAIALGFADEIMHRLEHDPDSFSHDQVRKMFETFADRSVAPSKGQKGVAPVGPSAVAVKIEFIESPPAPAMKVVDSIS